MPIPLVDVLEDNRLINPLKSIANAFRLNDGVAESYLGWGDLEKLYHKFES